jgi:hypothetical protein
VQVIETSKRNLGLPFTKAFARRGNHIFLLPPICPSAQVEIGETSFRLIIVRSITTQPRSKAMPRKKEDASKNLPPVVLYRDDLEDLSRAMEAGGYKATFSTKAMEYESLDELERDIGVKTDELEISAKKNSGVGNISVRFTSWGTYLSRYGGDAESSEAWFYLQSTLKDKRRQLGMLLKPEVWAYASFLAIMALIIFAANNLPVPLWLWMLAFTVIAIAHVSAFSPGEKSLLYLKRKRDIGTFLKRNSDDLVKMVLAAIVGALIPWLGKHLSFIFHR